MGATRDHTYIDNLLVCRCLVLLCVVPTKIRSLLVVRERRFVRIFLTVGDLPRARGTGTGLLVVQLVSGSVDIRRCRAKPVAICLVDTLGRRHFQTVQSV